MMMLEVTSLMPAADDSYLHLEAGDVSPERTGSPTTSLCAGVQFGALLTTSESVNLLTATSTATVRRRLSPPLDDLNTPATFTPTYSCGHFVFDPVGDFTLTTVDDLPTNGYI